MNFYKLFFINLIYLISFLMLICDNNEDENTPVEDKKFLEDNYLCFGRCLINNTNYLVIFININLIKIKIFLGN